MEPFTYLDFGIHHVDRHGDILRAVKEQSIGERNYILKFMIFAVAGQSRIYIIPYSRNIA